MRIAFILLLSVLMISCKNSDKNEDQQERNQDSVVNQENTSHQQNFQTYQNNQFNFELNYPENWRIVGNKVGREWEVINIYKPGKADEELPLKVHASEDLSFVSIFPQGYGTELPFGKESAWADIKDPLSLSLDIKHGESKVYQLDNGKIWAYYLKPDNTPGSWYDGFIFAQVAVDSFLVSCHDEVTGDSLSMEECDPLTGDVIRRYGDLNEDDKKIIYQILSSIEFTSVSEEKESIANLIKVENPYPNEDIRMPLEISGKARGTWYFEGDFPIRLMDKDENVLAEVVATAQGEWMTEDWVTFKATIKEVDLPDDERGYLVFQKDNPSGKPELDREFRLPVLFPSK